MTAKLPPADRCPHQPPTGDQDPHRSAPLRPDKTRDPNHGRHRNPTHKGRHRKQHHGLKRTGC